MSEAFTEGTLVLRAPPSTIAATSTKTLGGPPFVHMFDGPVGAGAYRVALVVQGPEGLRMSACRDVEVAAQAPPPRPRWGPLWPNEKAWDRRMESLYSAWVQELFDAPLDAPLNYPSLDRVLFDPEKNFLHGYLFSEPVLGAPNTPVIDPDCADFPYYLRAIFAFEGGLPFAYSSCTRGSALAPPTCTRTSTQLDVAPRQGPRTWASLTHFLRVTLADTVHSGNGRLPAESSLGDYYPIRLSSETLRPGVVYADPYGHMLVVTRRVAGSEGGGDVLFAVDGQPDATIGRKRFYRGNFLFEIDPVLGSAGFKRFRPVVAQPRGPRALDNAAIAQNPAYGDMALDQYAAGREGFYDAVEDVLSPRPLDPSRALLELVDALEEQVQARVRSVDNAEAWKKKDPRLIDMPKGAEIFETTGPWEDYSTPSRDLRLLIALDVVLGFPDRVARRLQRYAVPEGQDAEAIRQKLRAGLDEELGKRRFSYTRSDGTPQSLSLRDIVSRMDALEMAYNPNDCVEVRWGSAEGSDERATCKRRTTFSQTSRMNRQRSWFHERKRPPRP